MTIEESREKYRTYIEEHIMLVSKAYKYLNDNDIISKFFQLNKWDQMICNGRILMHDNNKFNPDIFEAYRKKFFPINEEEYNEDEFNNAWKRHYKLSPHHPEHWIDTDGNPHEMSDTFIIEMICDWIAMSVKFNNKVWDWFDQNRDRLRLLLADHTYNITNQFIEYLKLNDYQPEYNYK